MNKQPDTTEYVWLTVTTTNAGNEDRRVPADYTAWSKADHRAVARLERLADLAGTHLLRTSYRVL
jgi:hypothetical protein